MMAPVILAVRQQQQLVNKTPEKVILYLEPLVKGWSLTAVRGRVPPFMHRAKEQRVQCTPRIMMLLIHKQSNNNGLV